MAKTDDSLLDDALSTDARAAFTRRLVEWHLNELNGLQAQLRFLQAQAASSARVSVAADPAEARLRARQAAALEALGWDCAAALPVVWELIAEIVEEPEDVYAPALALQHLGEKPTKVQSWIATLSDAQRAALPLAEAKPR